MLRKIFLSLFTAAAFACQANTPIDPTVEGSHNLKPDAQQGIVTKEIVKLVENFHYKKIEIGDSLSAVVLNNYLKRLDEGHNYLLASDVKEFEQYKTKIDDELRDGELGALFKIFNVFQKRYDERLKYSLSQVSGKFSFASNEIYTYDRSKLPWFSTADEANKEWNKRVAYDRLNLKITGADEVKNTQTLKQRYENLLSQAAKTDNQDAFQVIIDAFTESIDPHTNYFVPQRAQEFNEEMARSFEGIGARLQLENEVVKIAEVISGGPAFKSKLLNADDKILAVAQGKDGEFVDVRGWKLSNTVQLIKGKKGTTVRLRVIPAGQELSAKPKIVELIREKIVLEDQSAKKAIKTIHVGGKDYKLGIIDIPGFYADFKAMQGGDPNYKSTTRDVRLILDTLKREKVDGVVIDLRANGGGSLMEAIELTGLFIKTGPVVQVKDPKKVEVDKDEDPGIAWEGPVGVMVDRFSASASEIFAGAIQDYGRGIIMGTQTYGKGTVQSSIDMSRVISPADKLLLMAQNKKDSDKSIPNSANAPRFGIINLTMAKFYRINGNSTQHKGVIPDIAFPMTYPADKFGESSEPSALPFDVIDPSTYNKVGDLSKVKAQLENKHEKRMKAAPEYKYLVEDIEQFNKRSAEATVTLNETQLKKERDEQEARTLARDNQRRALKGLPLLKKGETKPKDDVDFIQDESLQVMADFIQINSNNIQLSLKK